MAQQHTYATEIDAPIEHVFGLVEDSEKLKLWMPNLIETTYLSPSNPDNPVGIKFTQKIKECGKVSEYNGEVTGYSKPNHISVRVGNKHFFVDVNYHFKKIDTNKTHLNYSCTIKFQTTSAKVMGFMFSWMNKLILKKQMQKFKSIAEQSN